MNLMFPLWCAVLGGSFVFLDVDPTILFLVSPLGGGGLVHLLLVRFDNI
jgi:hypothetical protein